MVRSEYILLIIGMGIVTYVPRWFPLFFLSQRRLPHWFVEWLDLVPVAILGALIFPDLLITADPRRLELFQAKSLVALPTFLFALKTKALPPRVPRCNLCGTGQRVSRPALAALRATSA